MGGMMSKPKKVRPPAVPAPAALPTPSEDVSADAMKKQLGMSGYNKQRIVGSLTPSTGRKTRLG